MKNNMVCKNMKNYLNRKATIFKSAKQLSKLCDIPVLLILYGPDTPNNPETWCSESDCGSVIDKYYEKTRNKGVKVKPSNSKVKKMGDDDHQFLKKMSLDELKDLNGVLAGKIESVKQRIDGLKAGKGSGNSFESRDFQKSENLIDCGGFSGFEDVSINNMNVDPLFNDLGNLIDLGENKNCFDEVFNPIQTVYPSCNSDYNTDYNYNDGFNIDDLGCEFGFSNPLCEDNELMMDISDLDNIKFVEDDLDMINRLVTVDDGAFATELLCQ